MNAEAFREYLKIHIPGVWRFIMPCNLSNWMIIDFYNIAPETSHNGAHAENNRFSFTVKGFQNTYNSDNVKIEQGICTAGRNFKMRAKTNTPAKIAEYLVTYIEMIKSEVTPSTSALPSQ